MADDTYLYQNLANAIIYMAAKDYRDENEKLRKLKAREPPDTEEKVKKAEKEIKSIERFFLSDWYSCLTTIDGQWLLNKLQTEVKENES